MFSEISKNWQGVPLQSYETALNYISNTTTATGLTVTATLHHKRYQTSEHVTDEEMQLLNLRSRGIFPEWNYSITPQNLQGSRRM